MTRGRRMIRNSRGVILVFVVVVAAAMSLVFLSMSLLVSGAIRLNATRAAGQRALYAARAGICRAIYEYGKDPAKPYWHQVSEKLGRKLKYTVGTDANFLLIRSLQMMELESGELVIKGILMENMNDSKEIGIKAVEVYWGSNHDPEFETKSLGKVWIGGTFVWKGKADQGDLLPFDSPVFLDPMRGWLRKDDNKFVIKCDYLPESQKRIFAKFYFTDGSTRGIRVIGVPGTGAHNCGFSITSTGRDGRGAFPVKRTIEATYDAAARELTSWNEISDHI